MLVVETIAKIRRLALMKGMPNKASCRELGISRKVVRKVLRGGGCWKNASVAPLPTNRSNSHSARSGTSSRKSEPI
ncbi:hypothetical protein FF124_09205 [Martelella lutilitoris]|uniref:Helix-turn-helix domain-containing protein n=1 Tax=Martelella lutilitoris TaxID=2583532 RepID=A0A5C4JR61_9HYPH|nr:hypothetical protein FF124_09205 [Martelella lutilitoris]